jgi:hypothetical protein
MQKLLANYLFKYKNCSLPQIGTLHIKTQPAVSVLGVQKIHAPVSLISFTKDITDSKNVTEYIAVNKNINFDEAAYQLKNITNEILNLKQGEEFSIICVGVFTKSQNDKLLFNENKQAEIFTVPVYAERVIHPEDSHAILVGDRETDKNSMAEFFTDTVPVKKNKWWLWAAAILTFSIILIFIYIKNDNHNRLFGTAHKYELKEATDQYKKNP